MWHDKIQKTRVNFNKLPSVLAAMQQSTSAFTSGIASCNTKNSGSDTNIQLKSCPINCREKHSSCTNNSSHSGGSSEIHLVEVQQKDRSNVRGQTVRIDNTSFWKLILTHGCPSTTNIAGPSYLGLGFQSGEEQPGRPSPRACFAEFPPARNCST